MYILKTTDRTVLIVLFALNLVLNTAIADAGEPPMLINYGITGSWFEPATSGQGFVLDLVPSKNLLAAYWFTYPVDGGSREWYLAVGDISGAVTELTVYQTENGYFDLPGIVETNAVGSAYLAFSSCDNASLQYHIDALDISGEIPLQRIYADYFCQQFLASANTVVVSHSNAWTDIRGSWLFEGCVNLENNDSHGDERFEFTEATATLKIDHYALPNCQGPRSQQVLTLTSRRVDKTLAFLDGEEVIANRFVLTDAQSGQQIRQLFYVDDRGAEPLLTHGVLDSPVDDEGFPTELPRLFFARDEK